MAKDNKGPRGRSLNGNAEAEVFGSNSEIARKLKQYYEEIVSDDVPDRFAELLMKLEEADPSLKRE